MTTATVPSVIVVGGGLAGMVVARELALRGWRGAWRAIYALCFRTPVIENKHLGYGAESDAIGCGFFA